MVALSLTMTGPASAEDPLDQVSGTEDWGRARPQRNVRGEWADWYRARVKWRWARNLLRIEGARNRRLATVLRRAKALDRNTVRQLMQGDREDAAPSPRGRKRKSKDSGAGFEVPLERLDRDGQAIDEEGEKLLRQEKKDR